MIRPIISTTSRDAHRDMQIVSPLLKQSCRLIVIGDYHCAMQDSRDDDHQTHYRRMAQYGPHSMAELRTLLGYALHGQKVKPDAVLFLGDMISYPAWQMIEELTEIIRSLPLPVFFTAGNHDWHFEGTPGSDEAQRREWIQARLLPLYCGRDPLGYAETVAGVRIVMIDNSIYEILPEQLALLKREIASGLPLLVGLHIPLYLPFPDEHHQSVTGYGCGHPRWCGANDPYWQIEQRERWPEAGQRSETAEFCRLLREAENVLGIVAGHTHTFALDSFNDRFQMTAEMGRYHDLRLLPPENGNGTEI